MPDPNHQRHALQRGGARAQAVGSIAFVLAYVIDQLTKPLAHAAVAQLGTLEVTSFLSVTAGWNRGVAFGMATLAHPWVLIVIGAGLSAVMAVFLTRSESRTEKIGLGMAIGGALGNVVDRARFGAVRDFIDFYWNTWHWPAFNFADAFIVVGLLALLLPNGMPPAEKN